MTDISVLFGADSLNSNFFLTLLPSTSCKEASLKFNDAIYFKFSPTIGHCTTICSTSNLAPLSHLKFSAIVDSKQPAKPKQSETQKIVLKFDTTGNCSEILKENPILPQLTNLKSKNEFFKTTSVSSISKSTSNNSLGSSTEKSPPVINSSLGAENTTPKLLPSAKPAASSQKSEKPKRKVSSSSKSKEEPKQKKQHFSKAVTQKSLAAASDIFDEENSNDDDDADELKRFDKEKEQMVDEDNALELNRKEAEEMFIKDLNLKKAIENSHQECASDLPNEENGAKNSADLHKPKIIQKNQQSVAKKPPTSQKSVMLSFTQKRSEEASSSSPQISSSNKRQKLVTKTFQNEDGEFIQEDSWVDEEDDTLTPNSSSSVNSSPPVESSQTHLPKSKAIPPKAVPTSSSQKSAANSSKTKSGNIMSFFKPSSR